jgi:carbon monoxide dehydrogenase subunit G
MISNKKMRRYSNSLSASLIIPAVTLVVMAMPFVTFPQALATTINVTREISAPTNQIWEIISNIDNESQYWSVFKEINNINKIDNIIERQVVISAGPQNNTSHQIVMIYPNEMKIHANLTEGFVTGERILELDTISENKSRLKALWDIDLSGIPIIGRGFAENGIKQTTEEAVNRIAQQVE